MFHLKKLIDAGIIVEEKNRYILRAANLEAVVEDIQKDIYRACEDLRKIAKDIDEKLKI